MLKELVNVSCVFRQIENMYKNVHAAIRENPEAETKPEKPAEQKTKQKRYVTSVALTRSGVYHPLSRP